MGVAMPASPNRVELQATPPFDLETVVRSHGWSSLSPFHWEESTNTLSTSCELDTGPVTISMCQTEPGLIMSEWMGNTSALLICRTVNRILSLSADFSIFQKLCARQRGFQHVSTGGLGRLLRSPTLWEDVVKVLCTTNINWAGTKIMVKRLVDEFGAEVANGRRCFPGPGVLEEVGVQALADRAKLGYRAKSLAECATAVVTKRINLDAWEDEGTSSSQIQQEIRALRGFGDYAAATIMALTGRYDLVPVDSVYIDFVTRRYFGGTPPSRKAAVAVYDSWGEWRHLAYWFERHGH